VLAIAGINARNRKKAQANAWAFLWAVRFAITHAAHVDWCD